MDEATLYRQFLESGAPFNYYTLLRNITLICVEITIILGCITAWVWLVSHAIKAIKGRKERSK